MCRFKIGEGKESECESEEDDDLIIEEEFADGLHEGLVHTIEDYVTDFESDMFELIDNIDDSVWMKDNKVNVNNGRYRMCVEIEENKKIVSAKITYTPNTNHVEMIYDMKFLYHKHKQRRVKKLSKYCNNRKF